MVFNCSVVETCVRPEIIKMNTLGLITHGYLRTLSRLFTLIPLLFTTNFVGRVISAFTSIGNMSTDVFFAFLDLFRIAITNQISGWEPIMGVVMPLLPTMTSTPNHLDLVAALFSSNPESVIALVKNPTFARAVLARPIAAPARATLVQWVGGILPMISELNDVSIRIQSTVIQSQRCVLASRSTFFLTLLTNGMRESHMAELHLPEVVDVEAFLCLHEFMFTSAFRSINTFQGDEVAPCVRSCCVGRAYPGFHFILRVLNMADMLHVLSAVDLCQKILCEQLTATTLPIAIRFLSTNIFLDCPALRIACETIMTAHATHFFRNDFLGVNGLPIGKYDGTRFTIKE